MIKASYSKHVFKFNFPGGTSRGVLKEKSSWFIKIWDDLQPEHFGVGEVSIIHGLSPENEVTIENTLNKLCDNPQDYTTNKYDKLLKTPAVLFALETALLDLDQGGKRILYPSAFTKSEQGISINGLVWMGNKETMLERIKEKVENGFTCIKIKVGAINFNDELDLLKFIRKSFTANVLELRVDANGAFKPEEAQSKIEQLAKYKLHSIEQPIKAKQWIEMQKLCANSLIPIALDEELIGVSDEEQRIELLNQIKPQYIVIKPSLVGGLNETKKWAAIAKNKNIGWWITSALEGNIGLNAIAQWTYKYGSEMPQGLGTGQVFSNNIDSPLEIRGQELWYNKSIFWEM